MTKEESVAADESQTSNDLALILLAVLILCATIAIVSICIYNRNRGHSCCKKTTKVVDEKSAEDKLKSELRGKKKVNLKPLWDVKQDENGKTKIDMIAGHFETVSYLVPRGGG